MAILEKANCKSGMRGLFWMRIEPSNWLYSLHTREEPRITTLFSFFLPEHLVV